MGNIKKSFSCAFRVFILVSGLVLINTANFGVTYASTEVSWILSSDTTWTKANGPYILTGNVLVESGVTLTVEANTTLNLNEYYIRVNGTMIIQPGVTINTELEDTIIEVNGVLDARGTSTNPIYVNGSIYYYDTIAPIPPLFSAISFYESSVGWDEQTGSGCILENVIFTSTRVRVSSSVKITDNFFFDYGGVYVSGGSPNVSHNSFDGHSGVSVSDGSPEVSYNRLDSSSVTVSGGSPTFSENTISGGIHSGGGSPAFSNNTIDGVITINEGSPTLSNNVINGSIRIWDNPSTMITNNYITNGYILCGGGDVSITSNVLRQARLDNYLLYQRTRPSNNTAIWIKEGEVDIDGGPVIIENNLITDCDVGIDVFSTSSRGAQPSLIIQNNTIRNNGVGILIPPSVNPKIIYNNIYDNSFNIKLASHDSINLDAPYNWWGTTDIATINQTIYDFKYDFDLPTVNFVPLLTEANPEAPPIQIPTIPEFTEIPEFPSWIILPLILTMTLLANFYRKKFQNPRSANI